MGWIFDLDEVDAARLSARPAPRPEIEHETVVCRRYVPRRCRWLWIERDTPIIPAVVAGAVWREASAWLDVELPREWIRRLAVRADVIYFHNPRFRRKIRGSGNTGRDWLWMFTRHWLAAMIRKRSPQLYARLPASYSAGCDLPEAVQTANHAKLASQARHKMDAPNCVVR
ncbi:MAG: hypothetical protein ABSC01_02460 [Verrucomicrobiota bacterium]|jgi:hypothetical protein